jgi:F-type H+-transporting ATPase subunit a
MHAIVAAGDIPKNINILTFIERYLKDSSFGEIISDWESIIFSWVIGFLMTLFFYLGSYKQELIPGPLQNFLEWVLESFNLFIFGILGEDGKQYIPFLGTLFLYILSMNLFGLVPLMASPSSNLNVTLALSLCVFALVQYLNIKNMGIKGYFFHMAGSPQNAVGWAIAPLMFSIEFLTQISRPVTLALRLFGNILGEKILVAFFTLISITVLYFIPIQVPFMILGLLTNVMQAMVFTLLSTIYILLSVPHSEEIHIKH